MTAHPVVHARILVVARADQSLAGLGVQASSLDARAMVGSWGCSMDRETVVTLTMGIEA